MHIDCHIDPACPVAWATSRWLADVADRRDDVTLTLRQMSIAVLNAETTWAGCGRHVDSVKRRVPSAQWCDEHADSITRSLFSRLTGRKR